MTADTGAASPERDGDEHEDGLPDGPALGMDMVAHVVLERASFPPRRPALSLSQGRRFVARRVPAIRQGLGAALLLGLRFVQARLISVWGLLVAAYFCPPSIFAAFAVFGAAASFVSLPALMRLEAVFFRSNARYELALAFRLASASGGAFLALAALVLLVIVQLDWLPPAIGLIFFLSLAARIVLRLLWAEATAEGDFRAIGNSNLVQAVVQPLLMLVLIGIFGPKALALFLADALGHGTAALYMVVRRFSGIVALAHPRLWSLRGLAWGLARWSDAPRILLPSALLSFGFTTAPLLALPYAENPLLAAHVALAMRLLDMPTQMFATVSGPLVMNGVRAQTGPGRRRWIRWATLGLAAAATGVFLPIALGAHLFDGVFDGSKWAGVGEVIAVMTLFYAGIALFNPLHDIAASARTTFWQLASHAIALATIVATILWFGSLSHELLLAVGGISFARALAHLLLVWGASEDRETTPRAASGARPAAG
ncbi:MAG: hypothetical protein Q8S58_01100 [Bosea sp. (in: a-proteobacteria)]|uniref:hypothetical protein n=1 Tax=Bosea sp. (in: a-proteobacteria) TaxID=1871050 RepID=UPI002733A352|nr:hypothetical protein [Bosea sp. (in: a-proteobacteria)]MDP3255625.1 hypothetical protein [Bosea sp. (in: a-proteobacteria)]MDP3317699.1 hypothetical protein [Bosea sp. (in: a-proteobacteria)]